VFPGYALSSAPLSCHCGHGADAAGVDEGVLDLAPARDRQIRSVVIGAELDRRSRSGLYHRSSRWSFRRQLIDLHAVDESKGIRLRLGFENV
jgi:hypothetical protein